MEGLTLRSSYERRRAGGRGFVEALLTITSIFYIGNGMKEFNFFGNFHLKLRRIAWHVEENHRILFYVGLNNFYIEFLPVRSLYSSPFFCFENLLRYFCWKVWGKPGFKEKLNFSFKKFLTLLFRSLQ